MSNFFGMNDLSAEIMEMIGDSRKMVSEVENLSPTAARESAEIIAQEQRRIFDKADFKRNKRGHTYKLVNSSAVKVIAGRSPKSKITVFESGFDTPTLKKYPELIIIEFGRPGKSPRYSKRTESKRIKGAKNFRKKGDFPEEAQVMPVRMGFRAAKEKAFRHYADRLMNKAEEIFRR